MKKSVYIFNFISSTILLSACSSQSNLRSDEQQITYVVYDTVKISLSDTTETEEPKEPVSYNAPIYFPYLPEFTEQLAYELKQSLKNTELEGSIAVSNFVVLSESIEKGHTLGRQVAELLSTDLQNNKLPISVASLDNYIDIPKSQEVITANKIEDITNPAEASPPAVFNETLALMPNITYVCTGTLMETKHGVLINTKIIHRKTHRIIASANKTLPFAVLNVERSQAQ